MRHKIKRIQEKFREPSVTLLLFVQFFTIFGLGPLLSFGLDIPADLSSGIFVSVIVFVVISSKNFMPMIFAIFALSLSATAALLRQMTATALTDWLGAGGGLLAAGTVSWVVTRTVFGEGRMNQHRVLGAVVLYLNFAIMFSALYRLIAELNPGAFSGIPASFTRTTSVGDLMYFSISTLTTVGYGDIAPVNPVARSLANFEALIGQLYPAIVLARIVTLYTPKTKPEK